PVRVEKLPLRLLPGGVLLTMVTSGSAADRAGLKPGDVLLRYADAEIKGPDDLPRLIATHAKLKEVRVTLWREGRTGGRQVPSGALGVVLAREPAPQALAERHKVNPWLSAPGGDGNWQPLPGTRVEADSLRRLAAGAGLPFRLMADSEASEQALGQLASSG